MKYLAFLSLIFSSTALGFVVLPVEQQQHVFSMTKDKAEIAAAAEHIAADPEANQLRLIELSPTETRWVTEEGKLELKRQGLNFMDITDHQDLGATRFLHATKKSTPKYPHEPQFKKEISAVLANLTTTHMHDNLVEFTGHYTRYYKSDHGRKSSEWLAARIKETAPDIKVTPFRHTWPQSSLIASIPGRTKKTVVIGAHQDSINLFLPSLLGAPGADDDGSGTVTILEALRVISESKLLADKDGKLENTLEFHWYSAEEGGLLGSQAIFASYEREGRDVVAMLQQDMTGFVQRTLDAGKPESVGVITDYVDPALTNFIKKVIETYCDIPYVETKCGYACSDHASASKAGYPSAFVIESEFGLSDNKIHTTEDKVELLSFEHMLQHAKLTVGLALELAMAKFD